MHAVDIDTFLKSEFFLSPKQHQLILTPSISREENQGKNNQNSCSLSKILVCNLSIVPFNRSIANSSNSSKVMLSVGGTLYICKPCVCFLAFCELSRGLVRLLLFFRLPEKSIFWDDVCGSEKDIFDRLFSRQMIRYGKLVNSPFAISNFPRTALLVIYELAAILKFVAPNHRLHRSPRWSLKYNEKNLQRLLRINWGQRPTVKRGMLALDESNFSLIKFVFSCFGSFRMISCSYYSI